MFKHFLSPHMLLADLVNSSSRLSMFQYKFFISYLVIGRGGEMINKLQSESGAKIQVAAGMFQLLSLIFEIVNS